MELPARLEFEFGTNQFCVVWSAMNCLKKGVALLLGCAFAYGAAFAAEQPAEKPEVLIKRALEASRSDLKVQTVTASEIPGLYSAQFENGPMVYVTPDAKYFVLGDLYQVQGKSYVNLAEERRNVDRAKQLAGVPLKDMIVFKPKVATKGVINVFTDVECGWCQHFHKDVPQLNAMGIEVRYLAFPRAGLGSEDYKKMVTTWCAKDRPAMLTRYKTGQQIPLNLCDNNPVAAQFQLGERLGVQGTPTLMTAKGEVIPGYVPPEELAKTLGIQ
ncbi:MAG: protein-disulfide isomerase [Verrucomicrobiaceae bacterium]|nr:protein-disulfide isomerase [Verrucomicrobiaceae bacterium]